MTPTKSVTVAELAAQSLAAIRVFEDLGIDYCCGGKRPLEEVCLEKGLDPADVELALQTATPGAAAETDWNTAPLTALIQHIVARHHAFLRSEMPRVADRLSRVQAAHGHRDPVRLDELGEVFGGLRGELLTHLQKEESVLFPAIERFESANSGGDSLPKPCFGSVQFPITVMEQEHEAAGGALVMRELTDDYAVPEYACSTYRAMLDGLKELEQDLHRHIHLENNILFPRAMMMEASKR